MIVCEKTGASARGPAVEGATVASAPPLLVGRAARVVAVAVGRRVLVGRGVWVGRGVFVAVAVAVAVGVGVPVGVGVNVGVGVHAAAIAVSAVAVCTAICSGVGPQADASQANTSPVLAAL
jgi:hypothetical protein